MCVLTDKQRLDALQAILASGDDVSLIGGTTIVAVTSGRIREYRDLRSALDGIVRHPPAVNLGQSDKGCPAFLAEVR